MKILDKITMRLRSDDFSTMEVYMDVYDTPLGRKWLTACLLYTSDAADE